MADNPKIPDAVSIDTNALRVIAGAPADAILREFDRLNAEIDHLRAESERLRAALAQSDQPCAYCSLPADEWAKCQSGFPGCARADDALGCPELGARLENERLREYLGKAAESLDEVADNFELSDTVKLKLKFAAMCARMASKEGKSDDQN